MATPIEHTQRAALDRIEWVIRTVLPDELVAATPEGLDVPTPPTAEECYLLAEGLGESILSTGKALVVEAAGSARFTDYATADSALRRVMMTIPVRVRVFFQRFGQAPYTRPNTSRPCSEEELMSLAAEVYKGALLKIAYRDLPDAQVIADVNVTRNFSGFATIGEAGYAAVALVELDVLCEATIPAPRRSYRKGTDL